MKIIEIKLFSYDELSKQAKEKALVEWIDGNDYPFLSDNLNEKLHELLLENGIHDLNDTSKPGTKPTQVLYSLNYSQGDGAMFEGKYLWREYLVKIKHSDHYYHSNSKTIEITKLVDGQEIEADEITAQEFENIYQKICKALEEFGYEEIESEDSEEAFIETCEANEYTFEENGKMHNA